MPGRTVSRRRVVGLLGGGVAFAPAIARAFSESATTSSGGLLEESADRAALLAPLCEGSKIRGWSIASIGELDQGAVTVELSGDDGHRFRLEVLARDPSPIAPRPPAQTARFAVYVRNGGDGWAPTVEEQGLAAMALGSIIEANEASVSSAGFLTHADRLAKHSASLLKTASTSKRSKRA